jgi:hypothetical protein
MKSVVNESKWGWLLPDGGAIECIGCAVIEP